MPAARPHRADQEFADVGPLGEVPLATYAGRFGARLLDFALLLLLVYLPYAFLTQGGLLGLAVVTLAVQVGYDVVMVAKGGSSFGKRITGIKVMRQSTGEPPGWGAALVRALTLVVLTWVVVAVTALHDQRRHRGWHDRVARTVVVAV